MAKFRLTGLRENLNYESARLIIRYLDSEGKRIMELANNSRTTQVRSGAQKNAYGYRVYYNGLKQSEGYLDRTSDEVHKGWAKHNIPANTGRGYLMDFFNSYTPIGKGFELIVVNAVYYTQILEDGMQNSLHHKYEVISQVRDNFDNLQRQLREKGIKSNIEKISPVI